MDKRKKIKRNYEELEDIFDRIHEEKEKEREETLEHVRKQRKRVWDDYEL